MLFRASIQQPGDRPDTTDRTGDDERGAPAHAIVIIGTTSGVTTHRCSCRDEDTSVQAHALLLRKPFSDSFDRGWKISRLTEAEEETRHRSRRQFNRAWPIAAALQKMMASEKPCACRYDRSNVRRRADRSRSVEREDDPTVVSTDQPISSDRCLEDASDTWRSM